MWPLTCTHTPANTSLSTAKERMLVGHHRQTGQSPPRGGRREHLPFLACQAELPPVPLHLFAQLGNLVLHVHAEVLVHLVGAGWASTTCLLGTLRHAQRVVRVRTGALHLGADQCSQWRTQGRRICGDRAATKHSDRHMASRRCGAVPDAGKQQTIHAIMSGWRMLEEAGSSRSSDHSCTDTPSLNVAIHSAAHPAVPRTRQRLLPLNRSIQSLCWPVARAIGAVLTLAAAGWTRSGLVVAGWLF